MDRNSIQASSGALKITIKGRVQGVGFRPFVFQMAKRYQIKGTVQNNMDGVHIHGEGEPYALTQFVQGLEKEAPRLARMDEVIVEKTAFLGYQRFEIIESEREGKSSLVIPIDSAVCKECVEEINDPDNFRYRYPFINCTQCGPRYTIIAELPYDRQATVMNEFTMCPQCKSEYDEPLNRRHHAQPIACDNCGPKVMLFSNEGKLIDKKDGAISQTIDFLLKGEIVAIKGIGGYHLACDAFNEGTVQRLRKQKKRPKRPLAVMAASIDAVEEICYVSDEERQLLLSPESPIVILKKRAGNGLAESIAPGMNSLGVMLPYTPLHHLLFAQKDLQVLVMTSANPSGLPMLFEDEIAFTYLDGLADYILTNNRRILHPVDDSVVQMIGKTINFIRRARGYVPDPLATTEPVHQVIALGSQQKNTFSLGRNNQIFIGPHIGEMENIEVISHFEKELAHLQKWLGVEGKIIAADLHPGYATNELAKKLGDKVYFIQHHHAHLAACLEDNKLTEPAYGIILDGTGYGEDGNIWGFEFLYGDKKQYQRLGHLKYTHLPSNEKAIKEPWRNAVGMIVDYFGKEGNIIAKKLFSNRETEIDILTNLMEKEMNSPLAGTCGRLFDAVSAILGICEKSTYDGEAAILLSEKMIDGDFEPYPFEININEQGLFEINFSKGLMEIINNRLTKTNIYIINQRFHETIVSICVEMMELIKEKYSFTNNVVLSGGSFHNPFLAKEIRKRLQLNGWKVFTHQRVPCNDGGLSLGQLVIAANRARSDEASIRI